MTADHPAGRAAGRSRTRMPTRGRSQLAVSRGWVRLAVGKDVRELLHVIARDQDLPALVLLAQAVDELGAQDVDLPVQDAPLVGDLGLFLGQLPDDVFQFDIRQGAEVGERVVHVWALLLSRTCAVLSLTNVSARPAGSLSIDQKVRLS